MKQFEFKVGVVSLKLQVKFACSISLAFRYHSREYPILEEKSLAQGQLSSPIRQFSGLQAEYDFNSSQFPDFQKITLLLYLHSSHGKLLIGTYSYKINDLTTRKTFSEKIKNSPDKAAEIKFELQVFTSPTSMGRSQVFGLMKVEKNVTQQKSKPAIQSKFQEYKNRERFKTSVEQTSKRPSLAISPEGLQASKSILLKSNVNSKLESPKNYLLKSNVSNKQFPPTYTSRIPISDDKSKIESLRRKVSEMRMTSPESNQKYLQKIMSLQKEHKVSSEKINKLELELKINTNNVKFQEKDLNTKKAKIEHLEGDIKLLENTNSSLEQKIREHEYSIKNLNEEKANLIQNMNNQSKKYQKREEHYKEQITQITKKSYELEKERETLKFSLQTLTNQLEESSKKALEQAKEKEKKWNQEKNNFNKKMINFEQSLQEVKNEKTSLQSEIQSFQKDIKELNFQLKKMKSETDKVRDQNEELSIQISKLEMSKTALEGELKEQKIVSSEIEHLKKVIAQKEEEIDILKMKVLSFEEELNESQNKIRALSLNNQGLEQQYEALYYEKVGDDEEIERRKRTIDDLIQENEDMTKTIEKLNLDIQKEELQHTQTNIELRENIKQLSQELQKTALALKHTKDEYFVEVQQRKFAEKNLFDSKKTIEENECLLEKLENEKSAGYFQISDLKGFQELLQNKNTYLSAQLEEIKKQKEANKLKSEKQIQNLESDLLQKQQEIQTLQLNCVKLTSQIQDLHNDIDKLAISLQEKEKKIDELKHEIELTHFETEQLGFAKSSLEQNNNQYQGNIIELNEKIQRMQVSLKDLDKQIKQLDSSLLEDQQNYDPNTAHENRIKKIQDILRIIDEKDKQLEENQSNIQKLQLNIQTLQTQNENLKGELLAKNKDFDILSKLKREMEQTITQNLGNLQNNLQNQSLELITLGILKGVNEEVLTSKDDSINALQKTMNDLNSKIRSLLSDKDNLAKNLEESDQNNKSLREDFKIQKGKFDKLTSETEELNRKLTKANQRDEENKSEALKLKNKIEEYSKLNSVLQGQLRQQKIKNNGLQVKITELRGKIQQLTAQINKKTEDLKLNQEEFSQREKQFNKKLSLLKTDVSQKSKQFVVCENEKKNRVLMLNQTIDQLRKQNYDLQTVTFSEKNNNAKLNSILGQLNNYLPKIEKAHNIKAYYMMPLKELLTKFEQIMKASDKMFTDFEKKNEKRQFSGSGSGSGFSQKMEKKNSVRKPPQQYK